MTRHKLIETLAEKIGISKRKSESILDALVEIIEKKLQKGEKVTITGFGTFDVGKRAARRGVDPRTKKEIQIPAMAMPRFRAGKRLKDNIRS